MDAINKEVGLIKNVLSSYDFDRLRMHFKNNPKLDSMSTDDFGRKLLGHQAEPILQEFSEILLPQVRDYFGTKTCVTSYSLFAEYCDETISLEKHKDVNACTYTLDLVTHRDRRACEVDMLHDSVISSHSHEVTPQPGRCVPQG